MRVGEVGHERGARAEVRVEADGRRHPDELPIPRVGWYEDAVLIPIVVVVVPAS